LPPDNLRGLFFACVIPVTFPFIEIANSSVKSRALTILNGIAFHSTDDMATGFMNALQSFLAKTLLHFRRQPPAGNREEDAFSKQNHQPPQRKKHAPSFKAVQQVATRTENAFLQLLLQQPEALPSRPLNHQEKHLVKAVINQLKDPQIRQHNIPRLPAIVPQLFKLLRNKEASCEQAIQLVRQDPVIAAVVLKLANSAYFNRSGQPVDSIERAVVNLGLEGLGAILSTAVMQPIIQVQQQGRQRFSQQLWEHSQTCAIACQIIARSHKGYEEDIFKAYFIGLIHDMGALALYTTLMTELKEAATTDISQTSVYIALYRQQATKLSHTIAQDWDFPDDIQQPLDEQLSPKSAHKKSLGKVLYLANIAAEIYLLHKNDCFDDDEINELITSIGLKRELFDEIALIHDETIH